MVYGDLGDGLLLFYHMIASFVGFWAQKKVDDF